jgi:hypothetical protein
VEEVSTLAAVEILREIPPYGREAGMHKYKFTLSQLQEYKITFIFFGDRKPSDEPQQ